MARCSGYDRHFTVCQYFGLQMVNVPMNADGPDMDTIEELVKDPSVKGMFCVPNNSNPTGIDFPACSGAPYCGASPGGRGLPHCVGQRLLRA